MIATSIERARLLIEQNRYNEAEKELLINLASDPNNVDALSLLSICKCENKKFKEAEEIIKTAIGISPANPLLIYIYAKILFYQEKYNEAEKTIKEAINISPQDADFWGLLSAVYLNQKDWNKALIYANKGLELSPDNLTCLNLRSTSLIKLDRKEESFSTIKEALNYDPNNASTHANLGWGLLEKGGHKKALDHFKKALQIDPQSSFAKTGLVEALKARYFIYRLFLKYAFWIGNMKSQMQWVIIIGFYIGSRIVNHVADTYPTLAPYLMPLIVLYIIFAVSTWIIGPITNLFLRFNVYGKYALTKTQIITSNFVGASFGIGLIALAMYLISGADLFLIIGFFGISMMIPLSNMLTPIKKKSRILLIGYTSLLALIGILGFTLLFMGNPVYDTLFTTYLIGFFLYQFVSNAVISR